MTHDQLAAFVAVATEGTFTLAAERLHKSQSAVSKLVRNLEDELCVLVFDRTGQRATLTDAGQTLLERALSVLEQVRELSSLGRALAGTHEPRVRVAVDAITPLRLVLGALRATGEAFPNVRIELSTEHMGGSLEVLEEGRVDLAVTSRDVDPRVIEAEPFTVVSITAVAHRDHPLALVRGPVPLEALREHPQIVLSDSARKSLGPSINVIESGLRWNVSEVAAKKEIILAGMGWGGLPLHLVEVELRRGTLVELVVREFRAGAIALQLARRRDRSIGPVAHLLWNGLRDCGRDAVNAKARTAPKGRRDPQRTRA